MNRILGINDDLRQQHQIGLEDGTRFSMLLEYSTISLGWYISLVYGEFKLPNLRVTTSPNFLQQYRNRIPFGIGCMTIENQEPTTPQDFLTERSKLMLLSAEEVSLYGEILSGQVST